MRIKPVVATGTIRISRTKATTLDNGRLHIPPMCSFWTASHTMHNSTHNWGPDAREYKPVRPQDLLSCPWIGPVPEYNGVRRGCNMQSALVGLRALVAHPFLYDDDVIHELRGGWCMKYLC